MIYFLKINPDAPTSLQQAPRINEEINGQMNKLFRLLCFYDLKETKLYMKLTLTKKLNFENLKIFFKVLL